MLAVVLARLEPLLRGDQPTSPLFARFAIEQTAHDAPVGTPLHLAMRYVEALRAGRLDLSADDMLRASGIAAFESVREALAPRDRFAISAWRARQEGRWRAIHERGC